MSDEKKEYHITSDTQKGRDFIALTTALGVDGMAEGINRIMDGLCPDCGSDEHNFETRCFKGESK